MSYIIHNLCLALFLLCISHGFVAWRYRFLLVTIIIIDDGRGIWIVVLHRTYVYLLKGIACSRIACYVDVHIAFFYLTFIKT